MEYTDIELKNEQWRDIDGYDGMYQVSSLGRVRSKKYGRWKVMRPKKEKNGYLRLILWKDGKRKDFLIHRLVAQAFIPNNDDAKNEINHINEIKSDNRVSNLEYCDRRYNNTYNDLHWRRKSSVRRKIEKLYDPNLSIKKNLELFRANGIECSEQTVLKLRNDLGLIGSNSQPVRSKIKKLYDPKLSIADNIEMFKEQGVECSKSTVIKLRRDLGLINRKQRHLERF